jgi:hypothetical protein
MRRTHAITASGRSVVWTRRLLLVAAAIWALAWPTAANATALSLDGSFSARILKPNFTGLCPPGVSGDQCGVIQLAGLGEAEFVYLFGPTFESTGRLGCFFVDGTFAITLRSDHSALSGALAGVFCEPGQSGPAGGAHTYGSPFTEDDTIAFAAGTGRFAGLYGTVAFHQAAAGALYSGTLKGTLTG